jgi:branched-chain amino acid aminotransferase
VAIFYVDGRFVPSEEATIPINDLALLRGFGIFDFLKTYNGKPFLLKEHIERLQKSAAQIGLELPWSQRELVDIVRQTQDQNMQSESNIRIVVTGGSSPDFITPQGKPRLLVLVTPLTEPPRSWYTEGVKIITIDSERHIPAAKSIDYIPATIALKQARRQSAIEAVYVDRGGYVLEGTTSNLFIFSENRLVTPGRAILNGITRQVVLKLAEGVYETEIRDIKSDELHTAAEVFITGSNKEIVPVVKIDETVVANGKPGKHTQILMNAFVTYANEKAQADWQR